jgi:hypothetical protein
MAYVPKSALRKIQKYARLVTPVKGVKVELPRYLTNETPGAGRFRIYFNGLRQQLCTLADVDAGKIIRYKAGVGSRPSTTDTEVLYGNVEIRLT